MHPFKVRASLVEPGVTLTPLTDVAYVWRTEVNPRYERLPAYLRRQYTRTFVRACECSSTLSECPLGRWPRLQCMPANSGCKRDSAASTAWTGWSTASSTPSTRAFRIIATIQVRVVGCLGVAVGRERCRRTGYDSLLLILPLSMVLSSLCDLVGKVNQANKTVDVSACDDAADDDE